MRWLALLAALQRLCVVLWVGGDFFFAVLLAPTAFRTLSDRHAAGRIVGTSLRELHWMGIVAGTIYVVAALLSSAKQRRNLFRQWRLALAMLMLGLTLYSQFSILPRMESTRSDSTTSSIFQALHRQSVWVEGGVLLVGLVLALSSDSGDLDADRPE